MAVNKVILLGYVGGDPDMRYPEPGRAIAYLSLATNEWNPKIGQEVTEWHRLVMGGENAKLAENYIRKGSRLYVEGKLRTREYTDRMQITRQRTEIVVEKLELLGRRSEPGS